MQLSHSPPVASARFDGPNLVSCAGLVSLAALAGECALAALGDEHLSVPTDEGANAGAKVGSLVAGMVAGADSIDDMAWLRHGAMGTVVDRPYAPSALGSFLREFSFGHVRQLDAVATRLLPRLADRTPLLAGIDGPDVLIDVDDTIVEVHGDAKQGFTQPTSGHRRALRADGFGVLSASQRVGGDPRRRRRVGHVRLDSKVKAAIAAIDERDWTPIEYTDAVYDQSTGQWISRAEVAEIGFTAFRSKNEVPPEP